MTFYFETTDFAIRYIGLGLRSLVKPINMCIINILFWHEVRDYDTWQYLNRLEDKNKYNKYVHQNSYHKRDVTVQVEDKGLMTRMYFTSICNQLSQLAAIVY